MLVYKYRGGKEDIFERDLTSIEKNYFWSSNFEELNDPWETIIKSDKFKIQSNSISWLLGKNTKEKFSNILVALEDLLSHNKKIGIYSLSKTYIDELLWAHYGNSHKGFCIEYDLDILLNSFKTEKIFSFPVKYNNTAPEIDFKDLTIKNDDLILKMTGFKSKRWEYEQEHRIITNSFGKQLYEFNALKSIYFGLRMCENHKLEIMNRLKGRGIKYFQIIQIEKTYRFDIKPIVDPNGSEITYFKQIPDSISNNKIQIKILEKEFYMYNRKGTITIELENIISKDIIEKFAEYIKEQLFQTADRVYIYYYLKEQKKNDIAWAISHITNGELEIQINDYVII
ncbi:DUF2971 domain-containing protein [Flavobacterium psychrophilum]|uniref:DUF2971 domain-containing protein n=1 Tax=Flavobacterium psychrophilum TaxID=96345 RepID=UPI0031395AE2